MTRTARLGELLAKKARGIVPGNRPDSVFELYSVPSFEARMPEIVNGCQIGSNKQIVVPGTVLLCKINPRINRSWVVGSFSQNEKIASTEWITFPPHNDVEPKYLSNFLSQEFIRQFLAANASGVGGSLTRVKASTVEDIEVTLPPVEEQRRIVAEIEKQFSRLDEAIAGLQRAKANLKRYKAAVLKAAVEGRLVPREADLARREGRSYETGSQLLQRILETRRRQWQGKGKYKEPAAPDTTDLPELPEGWVWAVAEQLSEFITKGTTPSAEKLTDGSGEIQFLKVYNLTFDGVLNHQHKPAFVSRETHHTELSRSKVAAGDVLINIVGPPLGQVSVVPESLSEANINQAIARFRPVAPLDSSFLAMLLMSEDVMRWATSRAKTTAGQANLTLELCRLLPLPLPPLAEQHRIVAEVDRLLSIAREVEAEVDANLKRAQGLRQAILAKAFSERVN
ncbi:MAG: restriction endonuclease subunit S [Rhodocyclaceae bacterium]|nr:restriction endonuclease subunit S [Rhodocyclaceae bacterium]